MTEGRSPEPAAPSTPPTAASRPALVDALGGRRGLIDSGLPVIVFVFVNSLVAAFTDAGTALRAALAAALVGGVAVVVLRLVRRETLQQALSGFLALALAVWLANRSGEARDFHLPHILWQIAYCTALLISAVVGRPAIGYLWAAVDGLDPSWRADRVLRRAFVVATLGWAAVFAVRATVLGSLYLLDRSGYLAAARLAMGWPVTIGAALATVAYVKRVRADQPA